MSRQATSAIMSPPKQILLIALFSRQIIYGIIVEIQE